MNDDQKLIAAVKEQVQIANEKKPEQVSLPETVAKLKAQFPQRPAAEIEQKLRDEAFQHDVFWKES